MSWQPTDDPQPGDKHACDAIEQVIVPRARDLGGFSVRRAQRARSWPRAANCRAISAPRPLLAPVIRIVLRAVGMMLRSVSGR